MKRIIIAIDGPAASGKSSTARILAQKLGYIYLDTGAMYRACAVAARDAGIAYSDHDAISSLMDKLDLKIIQSPEGNRLYLNGHDISLEIRTEEISRLASAISAIGIVRTKMVELQRRLGADKAVVLDGRDIGTVVFPQAELKIFLIADLEERARRRYKELCEKGQCHDFDEIVADLKQRDQNDSSRSIAPLVPAPDAVHLDTSKLSLDEQVQAIYALAIQRIEQS